MAELPEFQQRQYEFAAHLRDPAHVAPPADIEARRMEIYRNLFFNNIRNLLSNTFPVLCEIYGEERWDMLLRDFYRDHNSHSPLFPDLPREFLHYLAEERTTGNRTDTEDDPPYLYELAHYEWVEAGLLLAPDPEPLPDLDVSGDVLANAPVTSSVAWLLAYQWAVDQIGVEQQPDAPAPQPLYYLVYRNEEDKVVFLKINATSARLFEILSEDRLIAGRAALEQLAKELNHPNADKVVAGGANILADWLQRGIIRGTLPGNPC